jgi:hypothetical protein
MRQEPDDDCSNSSEKFHRHNPDCGPRNAATFIFFFQQLINIYIFRYEYSSGLGHVRVLVRAVGRALDVLLVNEHLDALLDDRDGGSEPSLNKY